MSNMTVLQTIQRARMCVRRRDFETARQLYQEILQKYPSNQQARKGLQDILLISQEPASSPPQETLRQLLASYRKGHFDDVVRKSERLVRTFSSSVMLWNILGAANKELGHFEAAMGCFKKAIDLDPFDAVSFVNLGIALRGIGNLKESEENILRALKINPNYADAYHHLGTVLFDQKRFDESIKNQIQAIQIDPQYVDAYVNLGNSLREQGKFDKAIEYYLQAQRIRPDCAEAFNNQGFALHGLGRWQEALACYDRAIALKPDYAEAYSNKGATLGNLGCWKDELACYNKAIALKPDYVAANWNKACALLVSGEFSEGWSLHEWRWELEQNGPRRRGFAQPLWLGKEPLSGKTILLHGEQGLGDSIQFCRYARLVAATGATVLLELPQPLVGLGGQLPHVAQVIESGKPLPAFDYHCPLLSLPLAMQTRLNTIPAEPNYLQSDPDKRMQWGELIGKKTRPRIGLVWSGNPGHVNDRNRSLPLANLLSHLPEGYEFICLQKELREEDRAAIGSSDIRFFGDELKDFTHTAALCDLMDVVISVDTSVAHLAGALGKETWILLPFAPDWRWLLDREDSPWYPSVRLYRQPTIGNWNHVLGKVRRDVDVRFH